MSGAVARIVTPRRAHGTLPGSPPERAETVREGCEYYAAVLHLDGDLVARLYRSAAGERWGVSHEAFAAALARSAAKAFGDLAPRPADLERYLGALHLADLALACACSAGHEGAWEHFVREYRPALYRAASAIDPSGGARELADSLYGELFGLREAGGERQSLFRYFHGRSSLGTWLRSILAQRHVDGIRSHRRLEPLPDAEGPSAPIAPPGPRRDPDRRRFAAALLAALALVIERLAPRDRLRLGWYHAQQMTLAQIGRMTGEHEATVSRHLTRTRRTIREQVEQHLREHEHFGDREIDECFASAVEDGGALDLASVLATGEGKVSPVARSQGGSLP